MSNQHAIIIIGAGMAGMSAARRLADANHPSLLLDKGRGLSGRMATRRWKEATFDHGAQFFSAKTTAFQHFVRAAVSQETVKEWRPVISDTIYPRWAGTTGMNAVPKYLGAGTTALKGKKVVRITEQDSGWQVTTDTRDVYQAKALIVTMPAPQAIQLLENSQVKLPDNPLPQIAYHPCLAVLAKLDQVSGIPAPGGIQTNGAVISWMADNFQKGISKVPSATIHASPSFSQKYLDGDLQEAGKLILEVAAELLAPAQVTDWQIHRWRYSLCYERYDAPFWQARTRYPLLFGGDGFGMGNIEGAYVSGQAMAEQLIQQLSTWT